jgi:hypothetical protein
MTLSYNTVSMKSGRRYTLAGLADASAAALDALGVEARNGQVRDRPDIRTIRYYSTLGLIDRPAERSGRTALYGDRHLLQVLAVKALQARGASLANVQRSLVGASDAELRGAVGPGLPAALAAAAEASAAEAPVTAPAVTGLSARGHHPPDGAFWRARPAPPGPARPAAMQPRQVTAIPLVPGATLLIDSDSAGPVDAAALRAAADPLLTYLTGAGLLPAPPTRPGAET